MPLKTFYACPWMHRTCCLHASASCSLAAVRPLTPDHLRALAQEWMKYHRSHSDAAPKLCVTREDDAEVGYGF
jgi:hypothetical protein